MSDTLHGAGGPDQGSSAAAPDARLDALLARMRAQSDFPALSESVGRIQSMATSERESVSSVTNEILKDVALTNKLLRLVNSAHYARGGSVGTVSRAVHLVGFNGIRNLALSLVLLEHLQDKNNAHLLKEEFLRALMAGAIAAELSASQAEGEEAFIGALFQNLGRMLTQFYFPQEAADIRALTSATHDAVTEEVAAGRVLGMRFETLGLGVSRAWGLPDNIQRCIARPAGEAPLQPVKDPQVAVRWSARAANEMADAMLHSDAAVVDVQLKQIGQRYGRALALSSAQLQGVTAVARDKLAAMAQAMEITVAADSPAAKLLAPMAAATADADAAEPLAVDTLTSTELQATAPVPASTTSATPALPDQPAGPAPSDPVAETLSAGIQDITNAMVEDFNLGDVLRMILEAMLRALAFQRVIFCLRDARSDTLTGRFGLGADVDDVVKRFQVPLGDGPALDLFATICRQGADTLIGDTSDPRIAARLPQWYRQSYHAASFLILPLALKGKLFGLIYADRADKNSLLLSERQLSLLRTLRNQAVMAFRQST